MRTSIAAALLTLAPLAVAQQGAPVAYPQDSPIAQLGHVAPLGYDLSTGMFSESRWQQLIDRPYLPPTGTAITGIAFASQATGRVTYRRLEITVSPIQTRRLDASFATNLPSPTVVLDVTSFTVDWTTSQWVEIPFATPIAYTGDSDLVIEVQKEVDPATNPQVVVEHALSSGPGRRDLPPTRWTAGLLGSGASVAPTATNADVPVRMRLVTFGEPTLVLRDDNLSSFNNHFSLGRPFELRVHAPPGWNHLAVVNQNFRTTPLVIPPIAGGLWVDPLVVLPVATIPASGVGVVTIPIPNTGRLVDEMFTVQGIAIDPIGSGGVRLTCSASLIVQS